MSVESEEHITHAKLTSRQGSIIAHNRLKGRINGIKLAFRTRLQHSVGAEYASKLLALYQIKDDASDGDAFAAIVKMITDIVFYTPALRSAETFPGPSYVAHFNEPNPWEGPWKGQTNHILDIAYLWGNYDGKYSSQSAKVANALAETVISYTWQKDDLPDFHDAEKVTVFGPSDNKIIKVVTSAQDMATQREHQILNLGADMGGLDAIRAAIDQFLISKP